MSFYLWGLKSGSWFYWTFNVFKEPTLSVTSLYRLTQRKRERENITGIKCKYYSCRIKSLLICSIFTCRAAGWKLDSLSEELRSHCGETISTTRIAWFSRLYSPMERGRWDVLLFKKEMSSGMFSTSTTLWNGKKNIHIYVGTAW